MSKVFAFAAALIVASPAIAADAPRLATSLGASEAQEEPALNRYIVPIVFALVVAALVFAVVDDGGSDSDTPASP